MHAGGNGGRQLDTGVQHGLRAREAGLSTASSGKPVSLGAACPATVSRATVSRVTGSATSSQQPRVVQMQWRRLSWASCSLCIACHPPTRALLVNHWRSQAMEQRPLSHKSYSIQCRQRVFRQRRAERRCRQRVFRQRRAERRCRQLAFRQRRAESRCRLAQPALRQCRARRCRVSQCVARRCRSQPMLCRLCPVRPGLIREKILMPPP